MTRILLSDNYNSYNLGDAAILEGMRHALDESIGNAEYQLTSSYPEIACRVHELPAIRWTPRGLASRHAVAGWLVRSLLWTLGRRWSLSLDALLNPEERQLMRGYWEADLVLGVGGAYLRDGYRLSWLRLWQMALAILLGKPVALYAQSIGPLDPHGRLVRLIRPVFSRLSLVTLRDEVSARILEQAGVTMRHCEVTADAALALPPVEPDTDRDWQPAGPGPLVGVSVLHWHKFEQGSYEAYVQALADALDQLWIRHGARTHFLSTTVAPAEAQLDVSGTSRDDLAAARDVAARLQQCPPESWRISERPLSLTTLRARIAAHDLWIGTRMHSCIFATMAGVPTVPIAYEPKVEGYFELLELADWPLDIETIDAASLLAAAERALDEASKLRKHMAERIPMLRSRSLSTAELVRGLIEAESM